MRTKEIIFPNNKVTYLNSYGKYLLDLLEIVNLEKESIEQEKDRVI